MYYTVHLTDYPELCYGYSTDSQRYEFNTMELINEYRGKTEADTWEFLNREYPGLPNTVFTVTAVPELMYNIHCTVGKYTYVMQQDESLVRIDRSTSAYATPNKVTADKLTHYMGHYAYTIPTTDEF